jgi:hypothetical protein
MSIFAARKIRTRLIARKNAPIERRDPTKEKFFFMVSEVVTRVVIP